jgi:hypothetical protein
MREGVLSKAVPRAAARLGLSLETLARVIGISTSSASRLQAGKFELKSGSKPFELGVLFVRLFRSLDAMVGGDEGTARAWLAAENDALIGRPMDQIITIEGLIRVVDYLDARRAIV